MILLTIIADTSRFSSRIQRWGVRLMEGLDCPVGPYHGAWYNTENGMFYDMNVKFRKVPFEHYAARHLYFFRPPVAIDPGFLEKMVGNRTYGILDVLFFPVAKFFGINLPGDHCTEALNDDIWFHGGRTPWTPYEAPPSPCEMLVWATSNLEAVNRDSLEN